MKKLYSIIAIILVMVALSLYGCSSRTTVYQPVPTPSYPLPVVPTIPPAPTLISIAVTPSYPSNLTVGNTQQFYCTALYSNGSAADITSDVTWSSYNTNVADFVTSSGLVEGTSAGVVNITSAFLGFVSAPISLTVIPSPTTTTSSVTTYTGQKNRIFNSASTETLLGTYLQPGQTITVSWSADGSLTGYIFDSNEYNNWQQPYGHISVSYWRSESGSQYTYSFTVQNADNYYVVLYDGFPAGSNSIEDYSFTVTVH